MQLANVKQMLLAGQKIRRMGRWMDGWTGCPVGKCWGQCCLFRGRKTFAPGKMTHTRK